MSTYLLCTSPCSLLLHAIALDETLSRLMKAVKASEQAAALPGRALHEQVNNAPSAGKLHSSPSSKLPSQQKHILVPGCDWQWQKNITESHSSYAQYLLALKQPCYRTFPDAIRSNPVVSV